MKFLLGGLLVLFGAAITWGTITDNLPNMVAAIGGSQLPAPPNSNKKVLGLNLFPSSKATVPGSSNPNSQVNKFAHDEAGGGIGGGLTEIAHLISDWV